MALKSIKLSYDVQPVAPRTGGWAVDGWCQPTFIDCIDGKGKFRDSAFVYDAMGMEVTNHG